jgi:hypothetical protein
VFLGDLRDKQLFAYYHNIAWSYIHVNLELQPNKTAQGDIDSTVAIFTYYSTYVMTTQGGPKKELTDATLN